MCRYYTVFSEKRFVLFQYSSCKYIQSTKTKIATWLLFSHRTLWACMSPEHITLMWLLSSPVVRWQRRGEVGHLWLPFVRKCLSSDSITPCRYGSVPSNMLLWWPKCCHWLPLLDQLSLILLCLRQNNVWQQVWARRNENQMRVRKWQFLYR